MCGFQQKQNQEILRKEKMPKWATKKLYAPNGIWTRVPSCFWRKPRQSRLSASKSLYDWSETEFRRFEIPDFDWPDYTIGAIEMQNISLFLNLFFWNMMSLLWFPERLSSMGAGNLLISVHVKSLFDFHSSSHKYEWARRDLNTGPPARLEEYWTESRTLI